MSTQVLHIAGQFLLIISVLSLIYVCYRYLITTTVQKDNPYDPNRKDYFNKTSVNKYSNSSVVERKKINPLDNSVLNIEVDIDRIMEEQSTFNPIQNTPYHSQEIKSTPNMTTEEVISKIQNITNNEELITSLKEDTSNDKVDFLGNKDYVDKFISPREELQTNEGISQINIRRSRRKEWGDD